MSELVSVVESRGTSFVNFSSKFNVCDHNGTQTSGKRVNLTQKDGVPSVNMTIGVAEARDMIASAIENDAEVINFRFNIQRSDNQKPWKQLARMIEKRAIQASGIVTRFGEYYNR